VTFVEDDDVVEATAIIGAVMTPDTP